MAALTVTHQSGDRYYVCGRLHNLGNMRRFQGDYVGAQHYYAEAVTIEEAIHLAQEAKEIGVEGAAQARRGFALLTLAQPPAAVAAFERSIVLRQQTGDRVQIVTPLAGLAAADWAIGEVAHAQSQVEVILRTIGDRPIGIADDPRRVYGACRQVLQAVGGERAATILLRARTHLAEQADRLTNARQRLRFIQQCEEALGDLLLPAG